MLTFYQDNLARASRLSTATQRKNVIALARMLGYKLHGAQAATADVVFSLGKPPAADVPVRAGTVVRTGEVTEPARFQLLADVVIPAGADPARATGVIKHSQTFTQVFDARGLADIDVPLALSDDDPHRIVLRKGMVGAGIPDAEGANVLLA